MQKAQISKIENNFKDARISNILKVFDALQTKIVLTVERDLVSLRSTPMSNYPSYNKENQRHIIQIKLFLYLYTE